MLGDVVLQGGDVESAGLVERRRHVAHGEDLDAELGEEPRGVVPHVAEPLDHGGRALQPESQVARRVLDAVHHPLAGGFLPAE